jgi:hypothetical protein
VTTHGTQAAKPQLHNVFKKIPTPVKDISSQDSNVKPYLRVKPKYRTVFFVVAVINIRV